MFTAYTPLDKCVGKEIRVQAGGAEYQGMLVGIYTTHGCPMLVLTPLTGAGAEQHIPLLHAVVTVGQG